MNFDDIKNKDNVINFASLLQDIKQKHKNIEFDLRKSKARLQNIVSKFVN